MHDRHRSPPYNEHSHSAQGHRPATLVQLAVKPENSLTVHRGLAATLRSLPHPHYRVGEIPTNKRPANSVYGARAACDRKQPVEKTTTSNNSTPP